MWVSETPQIQGRWLMRTRTQGAWFITNLSLELLGHKVVHFVIFWGAFILFSIGAAPICIPTTNAGRCSFLHILTNTMFCWFTDDSRSDRYEVISRCGFLCFEWVGKGWPYQVALWTDRVYFSEGKGQTPSVCAPCQDTVRAELPSTKVIN